jgi:serine/threonine protein kinase
MLSLGTVLRNRYRVDRMLEIGPLEGQYRGWDLVAGEPVVIVEMSAQPDLDAEALGALQQTFDETAATLEALRHPYIVRVLDHFCTPEATGTAGAAPTAFLILQAVPGQTLAELIRREKTVKERRVALWGQQLLDALAYAHGRGVLHRDIKPDNIIITPDDRALLTHFEVIALWNPSDPRTWTAKRVMGVPDYAPPERWEMKTSQIDARSDIYSLGATLYHALTGEQPLTAGERTSNPYRFLQVKSLAPRVGARLRTVILTAMELPPDKRYDGAAEMREAILKQAQPDTSSDPQPAPFLPKPQETSWPRILGWSLSTLVIIAAGWFGLWLNRNLELPPGHVLSFLARPSESRPGASPTDADQVTGPAAASSQQTAAGTPEEPENGVEAPLQPFISPESEPTPTATPATLPTAALVDRAGTPPEAWRATVTESFDDNTNQWVISDFEDDWGSVSRQVVNGTYRWEIDAAQAVSRWCTPDLEGDGGIATDFFVAVEAQRVSGPESAAYGLVLRHAGGSYYLFSVRDDGYYQFSLWAGFEWQAVIDWTQTTAVVPGEPNRLSALGSGSTFELYINNTAVGTAVNDQLTAGETGLSISTAATDGLAVFVFDNFELWEPDTGREALPTGD